MVEHAEGACYLLHDYSGAPHFVTAAPSVVPITANYHSSGVAHSEEVLGGAEEHPSMDSLLGPTAGDWSRGWKRHGCERCAEQ